MGTRMRVSRLIKATPTAVYQAFLDPEALAYWLAPDGMTGEVHSFDARVGGAFRVSLTYQDPEKGPRGKSSADRDTYHGRFVQLVPYTRIVKLIAFESDDPKFTGEMTITVELERADRHTTLTLTCEDIPFGIRPEDNEKGWKISLKKLAKLVE